MKIITTILVVLTGFAATATADTLRVATEGAYPPFNNIDSSGELVGFDIDIAKALCKEMQRDCDLVAQDWDGIIPSLINNKYDIIVASMSITEERKEKIDFTDAYYANYLSVVASSDSVTLDNFGSKTIGAQRSTVGSQWIEDQLGSRADIKLYDTFPAAFADLESGRVDAVVVDYIPAAEWLRDNSAYVLVAEKIDIDDSIGIGLRKGEDALRAEINSALKVILENGVYEEISLKHFGTNIY